MCLEKGSDQRYQLIVTLYIHSTLSINPSVHKQLVWSFRTFFEAHIVSCIILHGLFLQLRWQLFFNISSDSSFSLSSTTKTTSNSWLSPAFKKGGGALGVGYFTTKQEGLKIFCHVDIMFDVLLIPRDMRPPWIKITLNKDRKIRKIEYKLGSRTEVAEEVFSRLHTHHLAENSG